MPSTSARWSWWSPPALIGTAFYDHGAFVRSMVTGHSAGAGRPRVVAVRELRRGRPARDPVARPRRRHRRHRRSGTALFLTTEIASGRHRLGPVRDARAGHGDRRTPPARRRRPRSDRAGRRARRRVHRVRRRLRRVRSPLSTCSDSRTRPPASSRWSARSRPRRSTRCASCCGAPSTRCCSATGRTRSTPRPAWSAGSATTRCSRSGPSARRSSCPTRASTAGGVELASSGTAVTHVRRLALQLGDDEVGEIVVGLRPGDLTLSAGDERVLRIVAPLLAQTLRARALAADLQTSRGQAIAAIEEERRRLRRDLHDGLGPTLSGHRVHRRRGAQHAARPAGVGRRAAARPARRRRHGRRRDPAARLRHAAAGARRARPGAGAAPAGGDRCAPRTGGRCGSSVEAPEALPELPAAVETAAYRIATEALTNAARHSGSDDAALRIGMDAGRLSVTVRDGGRNGQPWTPGVGLSLDARTRRRGRRHPPRRRGVPTAAHRPGPPPARLTCHAESARSDVDFTPSRRTVTSFSRRVVRGRLGDQSRIGTRTPRSSATSTARS